MAIRPVLFTRHIQPLFTDEQRECMLEGPRGFDLHRYEDVASRAELIYGRLEDLSMPADDSGPWPPEWIAIFRRWIDEGLAP